MSSSRSSDRSGVLCRCYDVICFMQVHMLAEDIGKKLAMAEQVGAEGKVEESMKLMEEVSRALEFQTLFF